ncbi:hypothetical protein LXL04_034947 [Taraxacum kok-saghyz]
MGFNGRKSGPEQTHQKNKPKAIWTIHFIYLKSTVYIKPRSLGFTSALGFTAIPPTPAHLLKRSSRVLSQSHTSSRVLSDSDGAIPPSSRGLWNQFTNRRKRVESVHESIFPLHELLTTVHGLHLQLTDNRSTFVLQLRFVLQLDRFPLHEYVISYPANEILTSEVVGSDGLITSRSLPKSAGLNRCGKSCRLRWINYLRPDLKRGNFTPQEDQLIMVNDCIKITGIYAMDHDRAITKTNQYDECINEGIEGLLLLLFKGFFRVFGRFGTSSAQVFVQFFLTGSCYLAARLSSLVGTEIGVFFGVAALGSGLLKETVTDCILKLCYWISKQINNHTTNRPFEKKLLVARFAGTKPFAE